MSIKQVNSTTPGKCRVICVTAGKGGVGKSTVSVNLAISLAKKNNKVLLLDADLSLSNLDVMLGLPAKKNISQLLTGQLTLSDIILKGPAGVDLIPASSGQGLLSNLSKTEYAGIITAFQDLSNQYDYLIIDTAAGISDSVTSFLNAASEIVCVVCDEPTSITDTYALIKIMSRDFRVNRFSILPNMVLSNNQGKIVFERLRAVTDKFLDVQLDLLGTIEQDSYVKKSIRQQKAVTEQYPGSRAALAFRQVAKDLSKKRFANDVSGKTTFFQESIVLND